MYPSYHIHYICMCTYASVLATITNYVLHYIYLYILTCLYVYSIKWQAQYDNIIQSTEAQKKLLLSEIGIHKKEVRY